MSLDCYAKRVFVKMGFIDNLTGHETRDVTEIPGTLLRPLSSWNSFWRKLKFSVFNKKKNNTVFWQISGDFIVTFIVLACSTRIRNEKN